MLEMLLILARSNPTPTPVGVVLLLVVVIACWLLGEHLADQRARNALDRRAPGRRQGKEGG
jgi:hypothetical protein